MPGLPSIIPAPAPPLRSSKRIEERQQRETARQARRVKAAENNEVDWEAFMLQELLADEKEEQEQENNFENIEDKVISLLNSLIEQRRTLVRHVVEKEEEFCREHCLWHGILVFGDIRRGDVHLLSLSY